MSSSTPHRARQRRAESLAADSEPLPDADVTLPAPAPAPKKKAAARRAAVSDAAQHPPAPAAPAAPARRAKPRLQAVELPPDAAALSAPPAQAVGAGPGTRAPRRRKPADETTARAGAAADGQEGAAAWVPLVVAELAPGDGAPAAAPAPKKRKAPAKTDAAASKAKRGTSAARRRQTPGPAPERAEVTAAPPALEATAQQAAGIDATQQVPAAAEPAAIESAAVGAAVPRSDRTPQPVAWVSRLALADGDTATVVWRPADDCPQALVASAADGFDADGRLSPDDDGAVMRLLHAAAACGHAVEVDARIWPYLAARRDTRSRLAVLQAAYPEGAADPGLDGLLQVALAPFQAEGALWAVVAGRGLLADERGLGKGVQAIAAAQLWRRHFGLRHVLVVCAASQCAHWRQAWRRLAGVDACVLDRFEDAQATQSRPEAEVRIVSPAAIAAGALAATPWTPYLAIVDEPQRLALSGSDWSLIDAAQLLVLSGAALDADPALLETLVERLDAHRLGALGALREVQAARIDGTALPDAEIERLDARLSCLLLQRQRAEVAEQLPQRIWCARVIALPPNQRAAHERAVRHLSALLAGWRASGWLAVADQWPVAEALGALRACCQRSDPADGSSPLAEATIAAIQAQLDEWAADGAGPVALCCASASDRDRLAQRLGARANLFFVIPGEPVPAAAEAVLLAGMPWDDQVYPDAAGSPRGRPWMAVISDRSFDSALFDTLVQRRGAPAGPGASGWLEGEPLRRWLGAIDAALRPTPDAQAD